MVFVPLQVSDNGHEGFIISGNSSKQLKLLERLECEGLSDDVFLHVEGPHRLWLKKARQYYFTLRLSEGSEELSHSIGQTIDEGWCDILFAPSVTPPPPPSSLHLSSLPPSLSFLPPDVVLGICMCHPASQEGLQCWIRKVQERYSCLSKASIIYDISKPETATGVQEQEQAKIS